MKSLLPVFIILNCCISVSAQMPMASSGTIKRHENFQSKFVTARNVDVLLPDGYTSKKKCNVLNMH